MTAKTIVKKDRPAEILLIEDNYGDALLTQKAFAQAPIATHMTIAEDGEQALGILRRQPPYEAAACPDLILLDLNLPQMNGQEVLQQIKTDPVLKDIPVIILTSSRARVDVQQCYDLHANAYIIKPIDPQELSDIAHVISRFWFNMAVLSDHPSNITTGW